jgi:hypothetical protein
MLLKVNDPLIGGSSEYGKEKSIQPLTEALITASKI